MYFVFPRNNLNKYTDQPNLVNMLPYFLFFIGFFALIQGGNYLVDGSSSLAERFKISHLVIGLTIVAFGTSAPELVVSLLANLQDLSAISLGNVLGSNVANTLMVLGIAAIICPLSVRNNTIWKEIPLNVLVTLIVFFLANDILFDGALVSAISRVDGFVLMGFFLIFIYYTFTIAKQGGDITMEDPIKVYSMGKSLFLIVIGLIGLVLGAEWIVDGAVEIATQFGLSQSLISLTIIAVGTSLPEVAASAVAAYKGNSDMAIGNVVGSNLFNLLWVLGISAAVKPLHVDALTNSSIGFALAAIVLLFLFLSFTKTKKVTRMEGSFLLLLYFGYLGYLIVAS